MKNSLIALRVMMCLSAAFSSFANATEWQFIDEMADSKSGVSIQMRRC